MPHFVRVQPAGWVLNQVLTSAEANALDIDHFKSVNGDDGGAWVPGAKIELGGAGVELTAVVGAASNVQLASRDITRHQSMLGDSISANWTLRPYGVWRNTAVGGSLYLSLDRLLHGGQLTEVAVRYVPGGVHGGNITVPSFDLFRVDLDGAVVNLGTSTDPTGGVAPACDAARWLTLTGLAEVMDLTLYRYWLTIIGETGANFVANGEMTSSYTIVRCTSYSEY